MTKYNGELGIKDFQEKNEEDIKKRKRKGDSEISKKRNSNCSAQIDWDPIIGFGVVALGSITITAIVIDDTTAIGVADDGLIIPLHEMIRRGFDAMIR